MTVCAHFASPHHEWHGAVSSNVFLTTVTDCVGFFSFLGLATLVLVLV
jgi:Mg/Co/Ni transporter MgtE